MQFDCDAMKLRRLQALLLVAASALAFAPAPRARPPTARRAGFGAPPKHKPPTVAKKYSKAALEKAHEVFDAVKASPGGYTVDVYCGAPGGAKLFFVGKVAHDLKTPPECALAALRYLLEPHACFLQPLLVPHAAGLDWGVAPGNTEVAVAKGEEAITLVDLGKAKTSHKPGFAPEWYEQGEEGFYVRRE